jgi:hypothetical protein
MRANTDDSENGGKHAGGGKIQVPSVEEVGAQDVVQFRLIPKQKP